MLYSNEYINIDSQRHCVLVPCYMLSCSLGLVLHSRWKHLKQRIKIQLIMQQQTFGNKCFYIVFVRWKWWSCTCSFIKNVFCHSISSYILNRRMILKDTGGRILLLVKSISRDTVLLNLSDIDNTVILIHVLYLSVGTHRHMHSKCTHTVLLLEYHVYIW